MLIKIIMQIDYANLFMYLGLLINIHDDLTQNYGPLVARVKF